MSIDKKIDYVEQDGSLNFIKNSESVTVPKKFKARKNAPATKLAYITDAEAKMLKKKKPGTPHKGPKGIPSYDTFGSIDSSGRDTGVSGETASGFERGDSGERSRADARAAGFSPQDVQDFRSAAIAAGAGQRVNPGFFDSRDVIPRSEVLAAQRFAPKAFNRARGRGGLLGLIRGGGIFGALARTLGRIFGLGKRSNEPTYDMSKLSGLPLGGSAAFENLDIRDKFNRLKDDDEEERSGILADPKTFLPQIPVDKVRPNVNLLAQPVYNLDGSLRENDAFGYLDLPNNYFDTDTNINTNKNTNTSGGIIPLLDSDDLGEELGQVVGKLNLSP